MAENIYDNFIEKDDENIIKTVKFLIRFYSKNLELIKLKKFFRWRLNSISEDNNRSNNSYVTNNQKDKKRMNDSLERSNNNNNNNINNNNNYNNNNNKYGFKDKEKPPKINSNKKIKEYNNANNNVNNNNTPNNNNVHMDYKYKTLEENDEKMNIHNRLYMDSYKKQENKMLNDEIKRLSELDKCTFKPKV